MEMTYYTGIDVSLRSVSICVVDDRARSVLRAKVAAEIDAIVERLRRFSSEVKSVGFEAGTLTQYLTYGLQAAGSKSFAWRPGKSASRWPRCATRPTATTPAALPRSSERLVQPVHVKSLQSHQVRALLGQPQGHPQEVRRSRERAARPAQGIRDPPASRVGHGSFDAELRETVSSDEMLACALVPLLDARTVLYKTYLKLDNAVKGLVRVDPICRRLMSILASGRSRR
jgi:hypothetical protein